MSQNRLIDKYLEKASRDWMMFEGFADYSKDYPPVEPHISIAHGYETHLPLGHLVALLMNGCLTSGKRRFLLSRNILQEYLKQDPNMTRKSFNGSQMNQMMKALMSTGLVARVSESSNKSGQGRKAAIYEIVDPDFLKYLPEYYQKEYPK